MIYMLLFILSILAAVAGLWKIFEKAGYKGWKALIPFYNAYIWLKVIDKPLWWFIFILLPFINVFTILLMVVETLKCFRKDGLGEQALGVLFPFVFLPWLGFSQKQEYTHPGKLPVIKKISCQGMGRRHHFCRHCRFHHPGVYAGSLYHTDLFNGTLAAGRRLPLREQAELRTTSAPYTHRFPFCPPHPAIDRPCQILPGMDTTATLSLPGVKKHQQ